MERINIAVIGCGVIANHAHLPPLAKMENVRIKYVVDLIEEKALQAKEKFGAEIALTDYRKALADKDVEAVFVLTTNFAHYTVTMDALKAGKHVFCEKPVTINYPLSKEMADEAKKQNKILNIGVCNRYHKSVELIREYVEQGKLGELYHIYCSFRSYRCIPNLGGDFTTKAKSGGGVIIDWAVHFFDLILYITGAKVTSVSANCYNKLGKDINSYVYKDMHAGPPNPAGVCDVEEFATGFIRTNKASISFNGAWAQNINAEELYVDFLGDKGGIRFAYHGGFKFYTVHDGILVTVEPDYKIPNMYEIEDKRFLEAIKGNIKTRSHIDNVLESSKLMDAVYESSEKLTEIKL